MRNESSNRKEIATSHKGHMWLMLIFCGLPIIGFLAIATLGVSLPFLELALFMICAIGMMYVMNRSSREKSKNVVGEKSDLDLGNMEYAKEPLDVDQIQTSLTSKSKRRFDE